MFRGRNPGGNSGGSSSGGCGITQSCPRDSECGVIKSCA